MYRHLIRNMIIGLIIMICLVLGFRWAHPYAFEHDMNTLNGRVYEQLSVDEIDKRLDHAKKSDDLTVIIFHKSGCKRCRSVEEYVYNQVQNTKMKVVTIDTKKQEQLKYVKQFQIHDVPTFIVMQNGHELERYSGNGEKGIESIFQTQGESND